MRLINNKPANVADEWKRQYYNEKTGWRPVLRGSSGEIYAKILAANGDAKLIDQAIGNDSWTRSWCMECKDYHDSAVELDGGDYGSSYCAKCLRQAVQLLDEAQ